MSRESVPLEEILASATGPELGPLPGITTEESEAYSRALDLTIIEALRHGPRPGRAAALNKHREEETNMNNVSVGDVSGPRWVGGVTNPDIRDAEVEALRAENADLHEDYARSVRYLQGRMDDAEEALGDVLAERDALQAQLDKIRGYAEERAAYGRSNRTVGSARIASDLFAILGAMTMNGDI